MPERRPSRRRRPRRTMLERLDADAIAALVDRVVDHRGNRVALPPPKTMLDHRGYLVCPRCHNDTVAFADVVEVVGLSRATCSSCRYRLSEAEWDRFCRELDEYDDLNGSGVPQHAGEVMWDDQMIDDDIGERESDDLYVDESGMPL